MSEQEEEYDPYLEEMLRRLDDMESGRAEMIPDAVVRPHAYLR